MNEEICLAGMCTFTLEKREALSGIQQLYSSSTTRAIHRGDLETSAAQTRKHAVIMVLFRSIFPTLEEPRRSGTTKLTVVTTLR